MSKAKKVSGGALRRCIKAPKGYRVCVVDSAQIECRMNAWLAGQTDLLDAFREGRDVYAEMASEIYKHEVNKKDHPEKRFIGKTTTLGAGYQMGGAKFQLTLAMGTMGPPVYVERELADDAIAAFRRKNYKIAAQWNKLQNLISSMASGAEFEMKCIRFTREAVELPNGLTLRYPNLRWREARNEDEFDGWVYGPYGEEGKSLYGGALDENIIQSLSYIVTSDQALEIAQRYQMTMFTHDEAVFLAKNKEADKAVEWAIDVMSQSPSWASDVPLAAEGHHDDCYRK